MKFRSKIDACFEGVLRVFQGCFKGVSRVFQGVSKKFNVAWHSSQLPEQKEGLLTLRGSEEAANSLGVLKIILTSTESLKKETIRS